jgi:hypothetical protein
VPGKTKSGRAAQAIKRGFHAVNEHFESGFSAVWRSVSRISTGDMSNNRQKCRSSNSFYPNLASDPG